MIKITKFGEVIRFDLSRKFAGRGRYWTTAYLIDGLLVDTGCAHTQRELVTALDSVELAKIVNTHSHEDHIGANNQILHHYKKVNLYAHPEAIAVLANPRVAQPLQLYRRLFWGWPKSSHAKPLSDQELIETERYQFKIIYTPGHSKDHLCLYEVNQGWVFSGDLFVGGRDRALRAGCDVWGVITSLKIINQLPIQTLFPGSARVRQNPQNELGRKIEYLEIKGEQVLNCAREGKSVAEIAQTVFGGPLLIELLTLGHFSRHNLVRSYLADNA